MINRYIYSVFLTGVVILFLINSSIGIAKTNTEKPLEALALYTMATGDDQKIDNICELLGISNNGESVSHAKSHKILENDEKPIDIRGVIVVPLDPNEPFDVIFAYRRSGWDQELGEMVNGYYLLTDETGRLKDAYHRRIWWDNGEKKQANFQTIDYDIKKLFKQETEFWLKWQDGKNP